MPATEPIIIDTAVREGQAITFYHEDHPFSNVYACPVSYNGLEYASVEHAYQSARFDPKLYPEIFHSIITADTALEANRIAQLNKRYSRADWNSRKFRVMIEICTAKFSQNPELRSLLISSVPKVLIEHAPQDSCWGMVTNEHGIAAGSNFAGRILMIVRKKLSSEV